MIACQFEAARGDRFQGLVLLMQLFDDFFCDFFLPLFDFSWFKADRKVKEMKHHNIFARSVFRSHYEHSNWDRFSFFHSIHSKGKNIPKQHQDFVVLLPLYLKAFKNETQRISWVWNSIWMLDIGTFVSLHIWSKRAAWIRVSIRDRNSASGPHGNEPHRSEAIEQLGLSRSTLGFKEWINQAGYDSKQPGSRVTCCMCPQTRFIVCGTSWGVWAWGADIKSWLLSN